MLKFAPSVYKIHILVHLLQWVKVLLTLLYLYVHVYLIKSCVDSLDCIPVACVTYVFQCLLDHFHCVWRLCFHPDIKQTRQNLVTSLQGQSFVKLTAHLVMDRRKQYNDMGLSRNIQNDGDSIYYVTLFKGQTQHMTFPNLNYYRKIQEIFCLRCKFYSYCDKLTLSWKLAHFQIKLYPTLTQLSEQI